MPYKDKQVALEKQKEYNRRWREKNPWWREAYNEIRRNAYELDEDN